MDAILEGFGSENLEEITESFNLAFKVMEEAGKAELSKTEANSSHVYEYPKEVFGLICRRVFSIQDPIKSGALDSLLEAAVCQYGDLRFHAYDLFPAILKEAQSSPNFDELAARVLTILTEVEVEKKFRQTLVPLPESWTKKTPIKCKADHKSAYTTCWLTILALIPASSLSLHKRILAVLDDAVIPSMTRPQLLIDYLTDAFNAGGIISLLALSSLFTLIRKHNLDYPSFFEKLYSLLDQRVLHISYRRRFLRLLNTFMQSTMLPSYVVAAYVKRVSRLALYAPASSILWVLPFCYNMLKQHPTCRVMIHREGVADVQSDPYNSDEPDLKACRALDSSLWDLQSLAKHHCAAVSRLAGIFSERFTKPLYDLDAFVDANGYDGMVEAELGHRWSKRPPTNYDIDPLPFD
jgi:U3 small nucleolar RNA-associated protein 19